MNPLYAKLHEKWEELFDWFRNFSFLGVALFGGVDSVVVCAAAMHTLGSKAEQSLIQPGLETLRVRYHAEIAHLEVSIEDFKVLMVNQNKVVNQIKQCGYKFVTLGLQGLRSGSLNEGNV